MNFEIKTKPTKLSRDNINIWVKKNCKKDRKISEGNLENSREEYFGERNEEGKMDGMGVYNFIVEYPGQESEATEEGQYYGEFINGIMDGEGVLIRPDSPSGPCTYVGKIKGTTKEGFGTLYINDGPTLIGDWKNDKMHGNGRIIFPGGGDYTGEWKDDKKDGKGTFIWNNGDKYIGEWKDDTQHGNGTLTHANEDKYVGEFKNEKKNGKGTFTRAGGFSSSQEEWVDGDKYVGEFKDDLFYGKGTLTYANGDKYEGEWKDGNYHGTGTKTWVSGDKYVGEWKDGNYHGTGTKTWVSGDKYVGEWKNDHYHGKGTYTWNNGSKYVGEWKDDNQQGKGTLTYANGDKYVGEFKDHKRYGKGTLTIVNTFRNDGGKYVGEHKDDLYHGKGTFTHFNGDIYVGEFKDDKRHGQGTYTWENNSKYIAEWENGLHKANGVYIDENNKEYIDINSIYIESSELTNKILELSDFKVDFNFKLGLLNSLEITEGLLDSISKDCENYKSSLLRKAVALNSNTSEATIMRLIKDEYRWVREAAATNQVIKEDMIKKLINEGDRYILKGLLKNSNTGAKEKEKINKLIANEEKYPIQYTEYVLGYDCNVFPSEHVIGSVELESLVDCIINNEGDWSGWIWENNWYDFDDYKHSYGLSEPPTDIEYPDGSRDSIEIKAEFEDEDDDLSEGTGWVSEVVSYEKAYGWDSWMTYTAELEYEFNPENILMGYDDDVISYIEYSEPNGLQDVEFESNDDYSTTGKGTDVSLYYDGNEIYDLADIVSEMKDAGIDVQSEKEVLSYLKENYG